MSPRAHFDSKQRIVVMGHIVRCPLGGLTWHYLQYMLGFKALGHDVFYVEDSYRFESDASAWCYDPDRNTVDPDPTPGLKFASHVFERVGLGDSWGYYDAGTAEWLGPNSRICRQRCENAELVVNVSGANPVRSWFEKTPIRVFIDTDPVFNQIRHIQNDTYRNLALQHSHFFSFAENIAQGTSNIPDDGIRWQTTRQPVALDHWEVSPGPAAGPYTTVMAWESYKGRTEKCGGLEYGLKSHSFEAVWDLPRSTRAAMEMSLFNSPAPRERLLGSGWQLRDGAAVSRDPWAYQDYIRNSKAEFSVAKHGYVVSNSGWFSERSACYLASGRPVLVENTGFTEWLETGQGIVPFVTAEDALAGIESIDSSYTRHCTAARELAANNFDAKRVLSSLIDKTCESATSSSPMLLKASERMKL